MCMRASPVWVLIMLHVSNACGGQNRVSDTLELEVEMVVGHHFMCAGNWTQVVYKSSQSS